MTHDAMTHDTVRPANEVRILELEVQKLEFEKRIAQLKAEQSINEDCIGCVGCCKVVDVAANLQKELDECSNMNSSLHEDIEGLKADYEIMRTNHYNTVAKLREDIRGLEVELSARKGDSEVLMEVVEIIKNWDGSYGRSFPTLIKILDELVDYTDVPEGPETPIDDLYRTTVSVFLEMP